MNIRGDLNKTLKMGWYTIFKKNGKVSVVSIILLVVFLIVSSSSGFSASLRRRRHIVERGENLTLISKRYGVSVTEIKKINNLTSDKIFPGQPLWIPWKGIWHTVREGECLELIAKAYAKAIGISTREMIAEIKNANWLPNPNMLVTGKKLFIPGAKKELKIKVPRKKSPPAQGIWHIIKQPGETIYRIALTYGEACGIKQKEMQKKIIEHPYNKNINPSNLQLGQKLFIPEVKKVLSIEIPSELLAKKKTPLSTNNIEATKRESQEKKPILSWPVEGEIIEYFDGENNKGITIAISAGETIIAPAEGIVELAEETKELGRCLFIKHEKEGLISCFTNIPLSTYLVKKGDEVKKAQPIAKIDISESNQTLYLYFQVRRIEDIKNPVNPLDYLP